MLFYMYWSFIYICSTYISSKLPEPVLFSRQRTGLENRRSPVRSPPWPIFFPKIEIGIATLLIPLAPQSIILTMFIWESSQWLGKNIVRGTCKKKSRKSPLHRCTGRCNITVTVLKEALNNVRYNTD